MELIKLRRLTIQALKPKPIYRISEVKKKECSSALLIFPCPISHLLPDPRPLGLLKIMAFRHVNPTDKDTVYIERFS